MKFSCFSFFYFVKIKTKITLYIFLKFVFWLIPQSVRLKAFHDLGKHKISKDWNVFIFFWFLAKHQNNPVCLLYKQRSTAFDGIVECNSLLIGTIFRFRLQKDVWKPFENERQKPNYWCLGNPVKYWWFLLMYATNSLTLSGTFL